MSYSLTLVSDTKNITQPLIRIVHMNAISINEWEFRQLSQMAKENFGLFMGPDKIGLIRSRLTPEMKKLGFARVKDYLQHLNRDSNKRDLATFASRLTSPSTFFFQENDQYDFLSNTAFPERFHSPLSTTNSHLNIWSAGCSTGEEPFSLSVLLHDLHKQYSPAFPIKILATDIETSTLQQAYLGVFSEKQLEKLPAESLNDYFDEEKNGRHKAHQKLRSTIHFTRYNLVREEMTFKQNFFVVFCRNVMIYFDRPTIQRLINQFYNVIEEGGYLLIGLDESLNMIDNPFKQIAPSIYQKVS